MLRYYCDIVKTIPSMNTIVNDSKWPQMIVDFEKKFYLINEKVSRLLSTIIYYWFTVLVTIRFLKKNPETNEEIKTHTLHIRYQVFHRLLGITLCKSSYHQQKQRGCVTKKWLFPHPHTFFEDSLHFDFEGGVKRVWT